MLLEYTLPWSQEKTVGAENGKNKCQNSTTHNPTKALNEYIKALSFSFRQINIISGKAHTYMFNKVLYLPLSIQETGNF